MVVFQVEAISKLMVNERVGDCSPALHQTQCGASVAKIARNDNKKGANAIRPNRLIIFRDNPCNS